MNKKQIDPVKLHSWENILVKIFEDEGRTKDLHSFGEHGSRRVDGAGWECLGS